MNINSLNKTSTARKAATKPPVVRFGFPAKGVREGVDERSLDAAPKVFAERAFAGAGRYEIAGAARGQRSIPIDDRVANLAAATVHSTLDAQKHGADEAGLPPAA
jgi:hypothetical protein